MAIKINLVVRLQHWMDSVPGQTFLNYAYSWGASIVILGALFKLTHLPGGNMMLFLGMGTEVVVFFLSAFDRPFDKTEDGKELPSDYETDEEIAARLGLVDEDEEPDGDGEDTLTEEVARHRTSAVPQQAAAVSGAQGGGTIIIGGGAQTASAAPADPVTAAREAIAAATPAGSEPFENEAQRLAAIIRAANDELLRRAQAVLSPEMESATQTYIEKLQTLSDTFAKVDEQSARLTKDSEEMDNLNRTLTGINKVYELHLKSISLQVGTIDQINEQTHKLAQQIEELNGVYGRMIEALTVNMRGGAAGPSSNA
ncbi:MAG: gliding motility protein GldL [Bacteroidaceae bacterium]|nr:gliding motility protein GldL [Bacteroidaceae bacterium]